MVVSEPKVELRTRGPLAPYMEMRGVTVRDLQVKVADSKRRWSRGTIGNLRKASHATVDRELARRIARALDFPFDVLFVARSSTVTRDVAPRRSGRAA